MKIENQKVVKATYDLYIKNEEGKEELMERATEETPLVWCQGENMMLPAFEAAMAGKEAGDHFDFVLQAAEAYGEYFPEGLQELPKTMFFNGDGEFDEERVYVGAVVPMNTVDGQIVKAQAQCRTVFRKRERMNADLASAVREVRVDVAGQRLRVGAGHIHVNMVRLADSVQYVVECDVGIVPVFGGDAGKVDVIGKDFAGQLDLIDEHIVPLAVMDEF